MTEAKAKIVSKSMITEGFIKKGGLNRSVSPRPDVKIKPTNPSKSKER